MTIALDKLQGEKSSYLGYVAPIIIALRSILKNKNNLILCSPLYLSIIKGHEKQYSYILASISHPKLKFSWIRIEFTKLCKNVFLIECKAINSIINIKSGNITSDNDNNDELYSSLIHDV